MLMFTLTISCLTTSNLPWFMDLTFQLPRQYWSLQHQTFLLSPVTSTAGRCFWFGCIPSFFLELFLRWSSVAYWAPAGLGSSSFSVLSFCLFILFMGFSRQEYRSGLPVPSPVGHILSDTFRHFVIAWRIALNTFQFEKAVIQFNLPSHQPFEGFSGRGRYRINIVGTVHIINMELRLGELRRLVQGLESCT